MGELYANWNLSEYFDLYKIEDNEEFDKIARAFIKVFAGVNKHKLH